MSYEAGHIEENQPEGYSETGVDKPLGKEEIEEAFPQTIKVAKDEDADGKRYAERKPENKAPE